MNDALHLLPSLSDEYDECVSPSKTPYLMIDQVRLYKLCTIISFFNK